VYPFCKANKSCADPHYGKYENLMIASIKKFFGSKKVRPTYPGRSTPWHQILPNILPRPKTPLSSSIILIISFAALIVLGGILLMLPAASKTGHFTSPNTPSLCQHQRYVLPAWVS